MKKPEKKKEIPQTTDQVASAPWVKDMQSFHSKNGYYRPQDLGKLLGDPLDPVEGEGQAELVFASKIAHKI